MGSFTFQTIVLVLIGAAVFALGTINIRGHFRMKRPGVLFKGKVLNVKLLERRDKEDRLIQHYYELQVQCRTTDKTFNAQSFLESSFFLWKCRDILCIRMDFGDKCRDIRLHAHGYYRSTSRRPIRLEDCLRIHRTVLQMDRL